MLRACGEWVRSTIKSIGILKQIDYYEGQFDQIEEVVISPPAVYVGYEQSEIDSTENPFGIVDMILYIATSKLARHPGNMLDVVEAMCQSLHHQAVRDKEGNYLGRCHVQGWKWQGAYPGIIVYSMNIRITA